MRHATRTVLGGLSPVAFLRRHWQKRPRFIPQGLPGFRDPVSRADLAAFACREDLDSRLVLVRGGRRPWQVLPGPLDPRRLRRLPPTHWTLLVRGLDRHVGALADLLGRFAFVPRWRIEDVMVSFAAPSGTVGPHIDAYDVFLVQGQGRRRWQIDTRARPEYRPGLDLRIVKSFRPEREWVLVPGDVLYVPPRVAHFGVALEDCLTYSVGFRAPSHRDLVLAAVQRLLAGMDAERLYGDPDLVPPREEGEIAGKALRRMRGLVQKELAALDGPDFARAVGTLVTAPLDGGPEPLARRITPGELDRLLRAGASLARSARSRIAFVQSRGGADLFVDGTLHSLASSVAPLARLVSGPPRLDVAEMRRSCRSRPALALLSRLVNDGALEIVAASS